MNRRPNTALSIRFPVWRARFVVSLFFLGFISLIARAFYCQGVNHEFLQSEAELRYERTKELVATGMGSHLRSVLRLRAYLRIRLN
jgi:cell division protein FtsI/penicillin-binding protein 2